MDTKEADPGESVSCTVFNCNQTYATSLALWQQKNVDNDKAIQDAKDAESKDPSGFPKEKPSDIRDIVYKAFRDFVVPAAAAEPTLFGTLFTDELTDLMKDFDTKYVALVGTQKPAMINTIRNKAGITVKDGTEILNNLHTALTTTP